MVEDRGTARLFWLLDLSDVEGLPEGSLRAVVCRKSDGARQSALL